MPQPLFAFIPGVPGWAEILVILALGVLLFGKRLPDVGRNVGRGIVEFKKGLKGIEHDVEDAVNHPAPPHELDRDGNAPPPPGENATAEAPTSSSDERR